MAIKWYYYDEDGVKQGPFTPMELKQHARVGAVRSNTRIETSDGRTSVASNVKGLFPEPPAVLKDKPVEPVSQAEPPPLDKETKVFVDVLYAQRKKERVMADKSANWYYYDVNGTKQGPYDTEKLRFFAQHGVVKKSTVLERMGELEVAEQVDWLNFKIEQPVEHTQQVHVVAGQRSITGDIVMGLFIFFIVIPIAIAVILFLFFGLAMV